ncbi:MAG: hypothetical protein ACJ746_05670 [Bryobacteraceae bacterium]
MSKKPLKISIREATLSPKKFEANRQNAQLSTGPTSEEGKAISSRNNFRHGFTGAFCLLPDESREDFDQLVADLSEEHQPATVTESILVNDMARHHWLHQRALRMQEDCFAFDLTAPDTQKQLNLFLRYGLTHERAFSRCLAALLKLRKDKLALERGFESQERERTRERTRQAEAKRAWEEAEAAREDDAAEWYCESFENLPRILAQIQKDREEAQEQKARKEGTRSASDRSRQAKQTEVN